MADRKLALVTGGAQGIGYASAEALMEDGCRVILVDINSEGVAKAAADLGGDAVGLVCDMGDSDAVMALFSEVESEYGIVEILVNNAGVAMPGDFLNYSLEDFKRVIDINLIGAFLATQRAARSMVENGIEGAIGNDFGLRYTQSKIHGNLVGCGICQR